MLPARRLFPPVFPLARHHAAPGQKGPNLPPGPNAMGGAPLIQHRQDRARLGEARRKSKDIRGFGANRRGTCRAQSKPTKRSVSPIGLRSETTALAGKSGSGQPSAMLFMIT